LEYLLGFNLVEESFVLFFGDLHFERLSRVLFEDEGVRFIDEEKEVGDVFNKFYVLLELFVE
jgi:hypothetical protein